MKKNNKGFTLAELLIVVAIIAVLVAIAIPVFTTQLESSREAVDASNIRSAYAEMMSEYLATGTAPANKTITAKQTDTSGWSRTFDFPEDLGNVAAASSWTMSWDATNEHPSIGSGSGSGSGGGGD